MIWIQNHAYIGAAMLTRIITGALLVLVLVPALIFFDTAVTPAVWAVIAAVSVAEVSKCVYSDSRDGSMNKMTVVILCAIATACPFLQFAIGWGSEQNSTSQIVPLMLSAAFAAVFVLYALGVFDAIKVSLSPRAETMTMLIYISAASVTTVAITQSAHGGVILPMVYLGSWITDSFAYFCGSFFGKHKLIPRISPKKTVEGSVGGTVLSTLFFAVYGIIVSNIAKLTVDYIALLISGLCLSLLSQVGDLVASYIKREHDVKDYGNIFPGHGGMFDRFDSVVAVTPILYLLTRVFTYFA